MTNSRRALMMLFVGALLTSLVGCAEYGYRLNEAYGLNCRPGALQHGKCVAMKGASK